MIKFTPWRKFKADLSQPTIQRYLRSIVSTGKKKLRSGMKGKKSGRFYHRRGKIHRASAPNEYPAIDTGHLFSTIGGEASTSKAVIGTDAPYSLYLRDGTSKMRKRAMSNHALMDSMNEVKMGRFIKWTR